MLSKIYTILLMSAALPAYSAVLTENFDNISTLSGAGWVVANNSTSPGSPWFQGNDAIFVSHSGADNSYIAANYLSGSSPGGISLWLLTPTLSFTSGDLVSFYTRTESPVIFADNLEVRLSTNGASTNVGATQSSVGDFSTLLLSANPAFATSNGYPETWTKLSAVVNFTGSGRLGFRYLVDDLSVNGNYIGIDSLSIGAADVPEPSTMALTALAGVALVAFRRRKQQ